MRTTSGSPTQHIDRTEKREGFPAAAWGYDTLFAIMSALFVSGIFLVGWATTHTSTAPTLASLWYTLLLVGFVLLLIRSFRVPFGALTLLITLNGFLLKESKDEHRRQRLFRFQPLSSFKYGKIEHKLYCNGRER